MLCFFNGSCIRLLPFKSRAFVKITCLISGNQVAPVLLFYQVQSANVLNILYVLVLQAISIQSARLLLRFCIKDGWAGKKNPPGYPGGKTKNRPKPRKNLRPVSREQINGSLLV